VLQVLFTLDYEIHGNGEGCPNELMVEPTARLLDLFDEYGAKLTIMADVGEILKFKEYAEQHGKDTFHYGRIVNQLQTAVRRGHDVQLHLHSSYFNAKHDGQRWAQNWSEYDFAGLSEERLNELIWVGKTFLESTLQPVQPEYRCIAFRAANWSVSPSKNVVKALARNGIKIDTSVFKYGRRQGLVNFDYRGAHSEMVPWRGDTDRIWKHDPKGDVWEVPIYSESRWIGAFLSANRVYRMFVGRQHRLPQDSYHAQANGAAKPRRDAAADRLGQIARRHAWKADFNQCTGGQLTQALRRAEKRHQLPGCDLPFVLIGHSKLFTRMNERSLRPFLAYVAGNPSRFGFATFDALNLDAVAAAASR
jgi:peptidoglycan/xylan/chitin deacetylase (PgdA/CDA1 family)